MNKTSQKLWWLKLEINSFAQETQYLSCAELGGYLRLWLRQFDTGILTEGMIREVLREDYSILWPRLKGKFEVNKEGGYHNLTMDEMRAGAFARVDHAKHASDSKMRKEAPQEERAPEVRIELEAEPPADVPFKSQDIVDYFKQQYEISYGVSHSGFSKGARGTDTAVKHHINSLHRDYSITAPLMKAVLKFGFVNHYNPQSAEVPTIPGMLSLKGIERYKRSLTSPIQSKELNAKQVDLIRIRGSLAKLSVQEVDDIVKSIAGDVKREDLSREEFDEILVLLDAAILKAKEKAKTEDSGYSRRRLEAKENWDTPEEVYESTPAKKETEAERKAKMEAGMKEHALLCNARAIKKQKENKNAGA